MKIKKILALGVILAVLSSIGIGFIGGFVYRETLIQDYVNIWLQEFVELPTDTTSVPVYAEVEVWYDRGTIYRFDTFTWNWGDGGYGPAERIPRGTILRVSMSFMIDATWDWLRDGIVAPLTYGIESQYIAGSRAEFFYNGTYGVYGYIMMDY